LSVRGGLQFANREFPRKYQQKDRTMKTEEKLYLAPEDLYRLGNATSPLMTRMRPGEVDIVAINGINTIVANRKGVSLYNKTGLALAPLKGWVWEISARHTGVS
jgi:hypothetical protein